MIISVQEINERSIQSVKEYFFGRVILFYFQTWFIDEILINKYSNFFFSLLNLLIFLSHKVYFSINLSLF